MMDPKGRQPKMTEVMVSRRLRQWRAALPRATSHGAGGPVEKRAEVAGRAAVEGAVHRLERKK